ncbi:Tat (Twin-arginine translocation) pathway signal sequence domain protein [Candidatus Rhodobacter oscarellae]|uniref:Tat (Twin-arginine translocation) pathway signal sequence domain protein n=1 Tax=Candidatus Rhodobacter oscarellae TaxID=1675527 RepID=A0A0J9E5Q1_9RHOB|nr:twin-arginine translocation pathway signal [Candidatus Rhodobacter lobularis]KMW58011.1 Tat (Twin-arginine translocation) pathway signal sequence domain protein [Candidatus Rhodobacter lobularis]
MTQAHGPKGLTRRQLLARATSASASLVVGAGFLASTDAAWAMETTALQPETMATLVQMARDIYPHDQVGDEFYATAVKGYDTEDAAPGIEQGIAKLNAAAQASGHGSYLAMGWERDRVDILRAMEGDAFFQQIRGGLVTGLYNQKAVWPIFGYEGASFEFGGYIDRGFNDINWL